MEPGIPAWKFRSRVPHLTLPRDYAIYFLSSMNGMMGLHLVARQSRGSDATVISFTAPSVGRADGQPLLRLLSSTNTNQLRLEYRTVRGLAPASILFPGGTPFGGWGRLALTLEPHRITLLVDCQEAVHFEKSARDDGLSLALPLDLEITFASTAGNRASKFTGYWQTAEISPSGFLQRPWHCDNLPDSLPLPYSVAEQRYAEADVGFNAEPGVGFNAKAAVSDRAQSQEQRSEANPHLHGPRPPAPARGAAPEPGQQHPEPHPHPEHTHSSGVAGWRWLQGRVCGGARGVPERRRFYRWETGRCEELVFSGCGGNGNNFVSRKACERRCVIGACCSRRPSTTAMTPGYDREGYDRYGYNVSGVDREGRTRPAFNSPDLLRTGGEIYSGLSDGRDFDKSGHDRHGYDRDGYHGDTGYNLTGYNRAGEHDTRHDFNPHGYTREGLSRVGLDCRGEDSQGFNYLGLFARTEYHCQHLSLAQCQLQHQPHLSQEVVSFSPGRRCQDVPCGQPCGCIFSGRSYHLGETFQAGCQVCVCSFTGSVECSCRHINQRKEIRDLSPEEASLYQHAIRTLYLQHGMWEDFARLRAEYLPQACGRSTFLPWHRAFLRAVELELQKVSCDISIPYLEWPLEAGALHSASAWQGSMFGGDGEPGTDCVTYHPFRDANPWQPCLRRRFNTSISLPDAVTLQLLLAEEDFSRFSLQLEMVSGLFHLWVGGHMATPFSPYDPLFLSHYAFVDKLWSVWQERHGQGLPTFPPQQRYLKMKPFDVAPDGVLLSRQQLCTVYVPVTLGAPCNGTGPVAPTAPLPRGLYDERGCDWQGYDGDGYDRSGWDRLGYSRDGFNRDGVDTDGFDVSGYDRYGFNRSGVSAFGMRRDGTYLPHVQQEVVSGLFPGGYNLYGFDRFGLDAKGFDVFGFDVAGYDKDSCNSFRHGPHYRRFYFLVQQQLSVAGPGVLAGMRRLCPPLTPLPRWWLLQTWLLTEELEPESTVRRLEETWTLSHTFDNNYVPNIASVRDQLWLPVTPDLRFCFELHWYSGCPVGTLPVTCPDLCRDSRCVGFPSAECHVRNCGSCFTEWYDRATGSHVMCQGCEYEREHHVNGDLFLSKANPCGQGFCDSLWLCCRCEQCEYEAQTLVDGQEFQPTQNPCLRCLCQAGTVSCERLEQNCPSVQCSHPAPRAAECCPTCDSCLYERELIHNGHTFHPPGAGPCLQCVCTDGSVHCQEEVCAPVTCPHPVVDPQLCCPVCKGVGGGEVRCGGCGEGRVSGMGVMWGAPDILSLPSGGCCPECSRCRYHQQDFSDGQEFTDPESPCHTCRCQAGTVHCLLRPCPPVTCTRPEQRPGQCCPKCPDCRYEEGVYVDGQRFPSPRSPCQECVCVNGSVSCQDRACRGALCSNPLAGSCCLNNCNGCNFAGKEYPNGADFPHPTNLCKECHCLNGNIQCLARRCRPLLCANPFLLPGDCCPQCPAPPAQCQYSGLHYKHMERFYDPTEPCRSCMCANGTVTCQRTPCAPCLCSHPILQDCCRTCDGCLFEGKEYANGEQFADPGDGCSVCACREGSVTCERRPCAVVECPFPMQGPCCRLCDGCGYLGEEYLNGQEFPAMEDRCSRCECSGGFVTCTKRPCYSPGCPHPSHSHGECCPVCEGCLYSGVTIGNGQTVPDPADPVCSQCTCRLGSAQCMRRLCAPVTCSHPIPGSCDCPQCEGCHYQGQDYMDGATFAAPRGECEECRCQTGTVRCGLKLCPEPQCPHPAFTPCGCAVCDGCSYNNRDCSNGETFTDPSNTCQICTCLAGAVSCVPVGCPALACGKPVELPGECCPRCPSACDYLGRVYTSGSTFTAPSDSCSKCSCLVMGVTVCVLQAGDVRCVNTLCPRLSCSQQVQEVGSCCPQCRGCMYGGKEQEEGATWSPAPCVSCMCVNGVTTCSHIRCLTPCLSPIPTSGDCCPRCADCVFEGQVYGPGESFTPNTDPCDICTCEVSLAGEQQLRCYQRQCPSLVDCPKHLIQFPAPDQCCPRCAQPLSNCTDSLHGSELLATDNPCYTCHCNDLTWTCVHQDCPLLSCPRHEQVTSEGACCPHCDECVIELERRRVSDGETWTDNTDACVTCTCNLGYIECQVEECEPLLCQDGLLAVTTPAHCCPECQDPMISCMYQGRVYSSNQHWEVDQCTRCTCVSGEVHCQTDRCTLLTCASDETPALVPGMCCPHCMPRPATCVAFGDPHYRTFDGKMIHFQGTCSYVLAQDCQAGDFSVRVTNDDRGRVGVAWTKEVTVLVADVHVRLLQDWAVTVDGHTVSLPFLREPYIYIERKTNTILLNTNIGVKVLWDGRSHLEVSVAGTYRGQTCGLCGNFNNFPQDELQLRSGLTTISQAAFGNSWKVTDGNETGAGCVDGQDIDPCKEAGYRARKEANAKCKILKSAAFQPCHTLVPPEMFFGSCVYDLCACGATGLPGGDTGDGCLCDVLEAYTSECREAGIILHWRSPGLCAGGCPLDRGMSILLGGEVNEVFMELNWCDRDQARSELLAARRLQEFVCRGSASVTPASDPCSGTPSHRALVRAELGLTSAQLKVVEQMCENHHLERLVALGFIYTRMMSPRPEPMAEIRCRERRVELRQQYLHYINGTVEEWVVVGMLREAFALYWEDAMRTRAPVTQPLSDLQLRQRAQLTQLLPHSHNMDSGDLMNLHLQLCALRHHHTNLATVLLDALKESPSDPEPVTPATELVTVEPELVTTVTKPVTVVKEPETVGMLPVTMEMEPLTVAKEPVDGLWDLEGPHRPRRERNLVLVSGQEQAVLRKNLATAQRKAQEKQLRDRERQTLRVQEQLCRAQSRSCAEWPEEQILQHHPMSSSSRSAGDAGRVLVRERLELLQHERSVTLKSRGQRNTDWFRQLCGAVGGSEEPRQTPGATTQRNSSEISSTSQY
eukprot:gi/632983773/ref/XP_007908814.1/ PREDICTED: kielin/chordin-like protein [Callorhinchus milii]